MIFGDVVKDIWFMEYRCTVIDRGMTSEKNLDDLLSLNLRVICGLRRSARLEKSYIDRLDRERSYTRRRTWCSSRTRRSMRNRSSTDQEG